MAHTEIIQPLRVIDKKPVDSKFICKDMDEALSLAYPGYICFIASTGKFYRFLANNEPQEWQVFNIEDVATKADIKNEIAKLVDGSPELLDTLAEISAALNNDQNFSQTIFNELKKVSKYFKETFKIESTTDMGIIGMDEPYKVTSITAPVGLTVTIKRSDGTAYNLGDNVAAFDFLTVMGDVLNKVFTIRGEIV